MRNLNVVAEQLFNEIRGRFPSVTIGDGDGNVTNEPAMARFYEFDFKSLGNTLGKISVTLDEKSGVTIMYNKDFTEEVGYTEQEEWYNFLKGVRVFAKKRLLNFEVRDINKSNFTQRDYSYMATNRGETKMNESALRGTNKTSYQRIGNAKLSIRHTGNIEEGESRTKKIGSLFVENAQGEKFKYPFKHLAGARAMAVHVSEGGHPFDDFGKHITSMSEELSNLRKFKTYMGRSSVMAESLSEHMETVNERIATVRKTVQSLQKSSNYTKAFENFEPTEKTVVPEDIADSWIDQLTVKQFNEELKDVFPYIYNLIGETSKPTELNFDDIVIEARVDEALPVIIGLLGLAGAAGYAAYKKLGAGNSPLGQALKQAADNGDTEAAEYLKNLGALVDGGDSRTLQMLKFRYMDEPASMNTESQIDVAFDKMLGQFADNFSAQVEGSSEKRWKQTSMDPKAAILKFGKDNVKIKKGGLNNGDDMVSVLTDDETDEGNAYSGAVAKAKMNGKKKGDTIPHPDKDEDDIVIEKEKTPLGEFILSYFDRQTGKFPKGETAVLTSVEKDYGDQYIKPASQFIERLGQAYTKYQQKKLGEVEVEENFLSRMIGAQGVKPDDFVKKAMKISQRYENLAFKNKIASDPNRPFNGKQGGAFLLELYMELINMSREIQKMGGGNKTMKNAQQQMSLIKQAMAGSVDNPHAARLMKAARYEPKFIIDFVKQDIQSMGESQDNESQDILKLAGLN